MAWPDFDWDEHLRRHRLGPALLEAHVADAVVTLHTSEYNAYEWVARSPGGMTQGPLEGIGGAFLLGRDDLELIIGLLPEGAIAAEARVGEVGEPVKVHMEPEAYSLVAPMSRSILLTFRDAAGSVIWEYSINARHRVHPLAIHEHSEDFRRRLMAEYRLGKALAIVQVGGAEVSIHHQEGALPDSLGEQNEVLVEPVRTLWALRYDPHKYTDGGTAGPLTLEGEEGQPFTSDPGCARVGEGLTFFAGTLPPGAAWAEARIGAAGTAPVVLTAGIFYTVVPWAEQVTVTIRDGEAAELARHDLPRWKPPRRRPSRRMYPLRWLRMRLDMLIPFARRPGRRYSYGPMGRRYGVRLPEECATLWGVPPEIPAHRQPGRPRFTALLGRVRRRSDGRGMG